MNARENPTRQSWLIFIALAFLLCAFNLLENRTFIFGPAVLETTDFAANALQIIDAKSFHDIYGNYSRWGFNHPGPFFFYAYALGEGVLFNALGVVKSPHQAHVFSGILVQSLFLSAAICCFISLTRRRLTGFVVLACASAFLPATVAAVTSIWPPHVLFGPYVLLIVSCAAMALGRHRWIPVATLAVCVLCHGHVAQPLMTIPMLLLASFLYLRNSRSASMDYRTAIKIALPQVLLALIIASIFLVPIALDLLRCPDCNAHRIASYMHSAGRPARWGQAFNYIASFFLFDHSPEWLDGVRKIRVLTSRTAIVAAMCAAALAAPALMKKKLGSEEYSSLRIIAVFAMFALLLSIIWAKRITGPLYEFNGFFVYGICFVLMAMAACAFILPLRQPKYSISAAALLCAVTVVVSLAYPAPKSFSALSAVRPAPQPISHNNLALINQTDRGDWPVMVALALWLKRSNVEYMVPRSWMFMYGWDRGSNAEKILQAGTQVEIWESGTDQEMLRKGAFDPSAFCRIGIDSQQPSLTGTSDAVTKARSACSMTTFGLDIPTGQSEGWTDGNIVAFQFAGRHVTGDVDFVLDIRPYLGSGTLRKQTVRINVNGVQVQSLDVSDERLVTVAIPGTVWNKSSVVTVTLALPDAASPSDLGLSNDNRKLGLMIHSVKVDYPAETTVPDRAAIENN
ncbi:hypothetical protein [Pinirhizobacter soli]|uniref:hypothetical protein n=1 Tax=Pinirhizobacter soli TaxID=2786953 RepID=UPI00202A69D2|nr:hypothetical protein [Pinirhizobacter soli]